MIDPLYHHVRNNHPVAFFLSAAAVVIALLTGLVGIVTANTEFLDTLGLRNAVARFHAGRQAVFWTYRAWRSDNDSLDLDPTHVYGFVESVNRDATVNITVVKDKQYQTQRIVLADLVITNPTKLATLIEAHKHDNMEFAFYPTNTEYPYTVIWRNNEPFNLTLITEGAAIPDRTPPTNIVDRLFAIYYWKQFTH
ncbi:hypothetical protein RHDC4_01570 [Rhodocyclaceae bacterium]|nr:hypothetical protein RHDC4_01570 [Rhodocyclaceae bacterium]